VAAPSEKAPGAFKTIGELSQELGVAQHILRYWETKFPELKPLQRAGNRRYYRPAEVELARRIDRLLNHEGYTMRGAQKALRSQTPAAAAPPSPAPANHFLSQSADSAPTVAARPSIPVERLRAVRDRLAAAIRN
jgi:DNA-binding transcriptional MerR regulator